MCEKPHREATLWIEALHRLSARSRKARFRRVASRYALGEAPSTPENAYDRVRGQTRIAAQMSRTEIGSARWASMYSIARPTM